MLRFVLAVMDFVSLMPEKAWEFGPDTKTIPIGGWLQGAVMPFGSGRAAFFGEAVMFTAQLSRDERPRQGKRVIHDDRLDSNYTFYIQPLMKVHSMAAFLV